MRRPAVPLLVVTLLSGLVSCGGATGGRGRSADVPQTCRLRVAPRLAPLAPAEPAPASAPDPVPSRLVANVELRLRALEKELEAAVPRRVAEERGRDIGVAGSLDYAIDRGAFTTAVDGDAILVRTELHAHADACAKGRCYAGCDPVGIATARVPLRLTPAYHFAPSQVSVEFTRGCSVRALGGFVRVDVTPMLKDLVAPTLRRVEKDIDAKLPSLRPEAERLWGELGKTRPLPFGGCVVVEPRAIFQGPASGTPDALRARFALVAHPELRARCGEPSPPRPLPPLAWDAALPAEDDLVLGMVSPLATATAEPDPQPFDVGSGARAAIARASFSADGPGARAELELRGEACGEIAARSPLGWTDDGRAIALTSPELWPGDAVRLESAAIDPAFVVRGVRTSARIAPPMAAGALKELVPEIARSMSDPRLDVEASVSSVTPASASVRGDDLVATVRLRGAVTLKPR